MNEPWKKWIPGVLSKKQIKQLREDGYIEGLADSAIDESSFDLSLSNDGYIMTEGSVKPSGHSYKWFIEHNKLAIRLNKSDTYDLDVRKT